jgi:hypothetical protein
MTTTDGNEQYEKEIKGIFKAVFRVVPPEELLLRQYWSEDHIELAGKLYSVIRKLTPAELLTIMTPQATESVPEAPKNETPEQATEEKAKPHKVAHKGKARIDYIEFGKKIRNALGVCGKPMTVYEIMKELSSGRAKTDNTLTMLMEEGIVGRSRENGRAEYKYTLTLIGRDAWLKDKFLAAPAVSGVSEPVPEPEKPVKPEEPEKKVSFPKSHIVKENQTPGKSAETIQKEMYKFMAEDPVICRGIYRTMYERFKDLDAEPVGAWDIKDYLLKYHRQVLEEFDFGPNDVNVMRAGTLLLEQMCRKALGTGKWMGLPLIQKVNATTYTVNHSAMKGFAKANRWP